MSICSSATALSFHFRDEGHGLPFVFQHGLGGDLEPAVRPYRPPEGVRLIAFDVRGHGETRPLGDVDKLTIATLADDLIALLDHLEIKQAVVGGISLGVGGGRQRCIAVSRSRAGSGARRGRRGSIGRCPRTSISTRRSPALIRELGPEEGAGAVSHVARISGDGTRFAGLRPFARRPV